MATTTERPRADDRAAKLRRYNELEGLTLFIGELYYLFDDVLPEDVLSLIHPDNLRLGDAEELFEELWPDGYDDAPAPDDDLDAYSNLVALLLVRVAGNSAWFSARAEERLGKGGD